MKKCSICGNWNEKNGDYCGEKCRARAYYLKNKERLLEKSKSYYSENKESIAERNKKYYEKKLSEDTEKVREQSRINARKYHETHKDDEEYKKMKAEYTKRYHEKHKNDEAYKKRKLENTRKFNERHKNDEEYKKKKAEYTKRYLRSKKQGLVWEVERENGEIARYRLSENIYIERVVDLNSNGNINKVINYLMINGEEHTSTDFGYSLEELKRIGEENYGK